MQGGPSALGIDAENNKATETPLGQRIVSSAKLNKKKNSTHGSTFDKAMTGLNKQQKPSRSSRPRPTRRSCPRPRRTRRPPAPTGTRRTSRWATSSGVQMFEKRNRAEVLKVVLDKVLVQIQYLDWESIYDEFLPVSALY
jgi:hypothetical protein